MIHLWIPASARTPVFDMSRYTHRSSALKYNPSDILRGASICDDADILQPSDPPNAFSRDEPLIGEELSFSAISGSGVRPNKVHGSISYRPVPPSNDVVVIKEAYDMVAVATFAALGLSPYDLREE